MGRENLQGVSGKVSWRRGWLSYLIKFTVQLNDGEKCMSVTNDQQNEERALGRAHERWVHKGKTVSLPRKFCKASWKIKSLFRLVE